MFHGWTIRLVSIKNAEQGQGLVEYALIVLFVSVAAVAALTLFGTTVSDLFDAVVGGFP